MKGKITYIVLKAGEFDEAVIASLTTVGAEIAAVIVVSQAGDVLTALETTRNGVQSTRQ